MSGAVAILADLRARGARVRVAGDRVRVEGVRPGALPRDLVDRAREHREELRALVEREAAPAAAQWLARFELLAAERRLVDGRDGDDARSRAFTELLVEWTEQHADVNALPNSMAEPIARMALAELGIREPRASTPSATVAVPRAFVFTDFTPDGIAPTGILTFRCRRCGAPTCSPVLHRAGPCGKRGAR